MQRSRGWRHRQRRPLKCNPTASRPVCQQAAARARHLRGRRRAQASNESWVLPKQHRARGRNQIAKRSETGERERAGKTATQMVGAQRSAEEERKRGSERQAPPAPRALVQRLWGWPLRAAAASHPRRSAPQCTVQGVAGQRRRLGSQFRTPRGFGRENSRAAAWWWPPGFCDQPQAKVLKRLRRSGSLLSTNTRPAHRSLFLK